MKKTQHSTRFLYIIDHTAGVLGFGVATTPTKRLHMYSEHSGGIAQQFYQLYYGPKTDIDALETHIKNEWAPFIQIRNGKHRQEWLDPEHNKTPQELEQLVDDKIIGHPMKDVKKLIDRYTPFKMSYSEISKANLNHDPDKYLQKIG